MIKELCSIEVSSFILDAEVVGIDRKKGNKLMSFQELSSRERGSKHSSIAIQNIKVMPLFFYLQSIVLVTLES
jgi:DNA ligase-1